MKREILWNNSVNILILLMVWMVAWFIVDPVRDFPLNDDWSYSLTVKALVENGKYLLHDWLGVPLFTQVIWGYLFCLPSGFSFSALTLSTLTLGLIGVIFCYLIVLRISRDPFVSLLTGLVIAFNPLFFSLSATFMTDIPYFAFFMAAMYFYLLHLQERRWKFWLSGTVIVVLAMLIRQIAVVLPLSFLLFILLNRPASQKKQLILYFVASVLTLAVYELYKWIIISKGMMSDNFRQASELFNIGLLDLGWRIYTRTGLMLLQAGLWLFPLLLVWFAQESGRIIRNYRALLIPVIILIFPMIRMYGEIPGENILFDLGLGPLTTVDAFMYKIDPPFFREPWIWHMILPLSFAGGIMLVALSGLKLMDWIDGYQERSLQDKTGSGLLGLIIILVSQGPMMISFTYFDRYLLPLLIPAVMLVYPQIKRVACRPLFSRIMIPFFILIMAYFSITGTKNYLEWNRIRWHAAKTLTSQGIPAYKIDGGHEYNGWHGAKIDKYGRWETKDMDYAITFSAMDGYDITDSLDAFNYITRKPYHLYILKRTE